MSDRSAKLLMLVADSLRVAANAGAFRKLAGWSDVPINNGLAQEILGWERGYVEHLAHVRERKKGLARAETREERLDRAMSDELALARVRDMVNNEVASEVARRESAELMKFWDGEAK